METSINYLAIIVCGVIAMVVGSVWYGPLFGKTWMRIVGVSEMDESRRKEMQKKAMPQYIIQFVLVLFQVLVLSHLINDTQSVTGLSRSLWIWAGFVMPTIAGCAMWTNDSSKIMRSRFMIQAGYQLSMFIIFGIILMNWN
ncbi:DUF1761 domain-containing protein [Candidatus Nomurabacteria bacterium]|nr:DUF1761 domain-containing protein [Candidatus Nomurabacteria bacterium]USN94980.1 MAG: DUF1761 domain-containing protein [Candidatus Nomurabacteria bacterium]